ncbi:MAG TPA: hypothetical protein VMR96_10215 [Solirubrobacterales bacterium]|nr:hypothetical protein [Solirubrobacterales bacterium]
MAVDLNRIVTAALESFLQEDGERQARQSESRSHHLGGVGAVAVGIGLTVAARAAYNRARRLDLEQVAGAIEDKLGR